MQPILDRLKTFFQPKAVTRTGEKLYAACVAQSRLPVFYLDYGVEDEIGARFELLAFHVAVVIQRLKTIAPEDSRREQAADTSQALFDAFMLALDDTLREQGTGDLSVAKKMKPLGQTFYTRLKRWDEMWKAEADRETQADYAARTIFARGDLEEEVGTDLVPEDITPKALAFAEYVIELRAGLSVDDLLDGLCHWPVPTALDTTV